MTIDKQKLIADTIMSKLEVIDPYCILAGGAPRDWYFGETANDLDFYYYSNAMTISRSKKQLERALGSEVEVVFEPQERRGSNKDGVLDLYKTMKDLRRIFEANIDGVKVQFMQLVSPNSSFNVLGQMSVSICKVWYKGGKSRYHQDFKLSVASKSMFLSDGYSWTDPHPSKIKERFKSLATGSKESAKKSVVNKVLRDFNMEGS